MIAAGVNAEQLGAQLLRQRAIAGRGVRRAGPQLTIPLQLLLRLLSLCRQHLLLAIVVSVVGAQLLPHDASQRSSQLNRIDALIVTAWRRWRRPKHILLQIVGQTDAILGSRRVVLVVVGVNTIASLRVRCCRRLCRCRRRD